MWASQPSIEYMNIYGTDDLTFIFRAIHVVEIMLGFNSTDNTSYFWSARVGIDFIR